MILAALPDLVTSLIENFIDLIRNGFDSTSELTSGIIVTVLTTALWLGPLLAFMYATYFLMSLPLRRQERTRLFLDLIEGGLAQGQSPEQSILSAAGSHDRVLGKRFQMLAQYLGHGLSLSDALRNVPDAIPPRVASMLELGNKVGDLRKIMPAIRSSLADATSKLTGAQNHLVVLWFVLNPIGPGLFALLSFVIVRRFEFIVTELSEGHAPPLFQFLIDHRYGILGTQFLVAVLVYLGAILYISGPRFVKWLGPVFTSIHDSVSRFLPWQRKRMQRDFSALLAVLLDAQVPENEAVLAAGECVDNAVFQRRCREVVRRLEAGIPITDAVQVLDETGEFRWRLTNARHGNRGFLTALAGWNDALDARAYQQEQAAAQGITTLIVIVNGVVIALIAGGIFQLIRACADSAGLW